ncbi:MAG TPA: hypothetical protein PKD61_36105, partial [Polyangiaceae bacterium]|nr:hypothetical protein [Polyangiaceae bacterium]
MNTPRLGWSSLVTLCLLALGCSSESASADGSGGASTGGGAGAGGADAGACSGDPSPQARCIQSVSGRVVDEKGAGIPKLLMSVCGSICYYGETEADGAFKVAVGARLDPAQYSTLPHGRPDRTNFYFQLPDSAADDFVAGDLLSLALPSGGEALVVKSDQNGAPAQSVTHAGVTLDVPSGVVVKIDVEDIALGNDGKLFRALRVDPAQHAAFVAPNMNVAELFHFTPFETGFQDDQGKPTKVQLSFPAPAGFSAGEA